MKFHLNYHTQWGESVAVRLEGKDDFIPLHYTDNDVWEGEIDADENICYRYCIVRDGEIIRQETACAPHYKDNEGWREPKRLAGIAVPVFSLRSSTSQGVGDFGDLYMLIDWVEKMGLKAIQILPINDTTTDGSWQDSYPYNTISTIALHPMYLDLRQIALPKTKACKEALQMLAKLNKLPQVDYEQVNVAKRKCIRLAYDKNAKKTLENADFQKWFEANKEWLVDYAIFRAKKDKQTDTTLYYYTQYALHVQLKKVADHARQKGIILKGDIPIGVSRDSVEVKSHPKLFNTKQSTGAPPDAFSDDGQIWGFPTYNWEKMAQDDYRWWKRRMCHMAQYFTAYRIDHILGFFRIWAIPTQYKSGLEGFFSPCLPLSPQEMMTNFGLHLNQKQVDTLFIEIAPGRFHPRINAPKIETFKNLSEPQQKAFLSLYEDFFYHRHNQFWYNEAMKKLPALTSSNLMICCGEDLGMIPECVPWLMHKENILSLEIQTMPKEYGVEFGNPEKYPQMSVCTISSHDTPTMRGWWEEEHEAAQRYYNNVLGLHGEAPQKAPAWVCERIVSAHLASTSLFCILTLQDWLAIDDNLRFDDAKAERINVPVNSRHYWRWRMHLDIDRLIKETTFNEHVGQLVLAYGR